MTRAKLINKLSEVIHDALIHEDSDEGLLTALRGIEEVARYINDNDFREDD